MRLDDELGYENDPMKNPSFYRGIYFSLKTNTWVTPKIPIYMLKLEINPRKLTWNMKKEPLEKENHLQGSRRVDGRGVLEGQSLLYIKSM